MKDLKLLEIVGVIASLDIEDSRKLVQIRSILKFLLPQFVSSDAYVTANSTKESKRQPTLCFFHSRQSKYVTMCTKYTEEQSLTL